MVQRHQVHENPTSRGICSWNGFPLFHRTRYQRHSSPHWTASVGVVETLMCVRGWGLGWGSPVAGSISAGPRGWWLCSAWAAWCHGKSLPRVSSTQISTCGWLLPFCGAVASPSLLSPHVWSVTDWEEWIWDTFLYSPKTMPLKFFSPESIIWSEVKVYLRLVCWPHPNIREQHRPPGSPLSVKV